MGWLQRADRTTSLIQMTDRSPPDLHPIRGIVLDVDGVLTDGKIVYSDGGEELKQFHVQDGGSIKLLLEQGIQVAIITGRQSSIVDRRAGELGIDFVAQGANSKSKALKQLISEGFPSSDLIAVGDDLQDLALFNAAAVSVSVTVPNGHPFVIEQADWVTERCGGEGIVAEIAQTLLQAQNRWPY